MVLFEWLDENLHDDDIDPDTGDATIEMGEKWLQEIDDIAGVDGFAEAMSSSSVAWIYSDEPGKITFRNFGRHNGKTAKTRALDARKKSRHRREKSPDDNGTKTGLEKRRERDNKTPISPSGKLPTTEEAKRVATIFHRRLTTAWSGREIKAFKNAAITSEDLDVVEPYYAAHWPPDRDKNILRHDLLTFLNNFQGEVDRARVWVKKNGDAKPAKPELDRNIPIDEWTAWWNAKYPNLSELHHNPAEAGAKFVREFWADRQKGGPDV
jgi:hypothetical protein